MSCRISMLFLGPALLLLVACENHLITFIPFTLPQEGFSIEHPRDWYIEDMRAMGNVVAFFPREPKPGESVDSLTVWIVPKNLFLSLGDFALSQKNDAESACDEPAPSLIGQRLYEGLRMQCQDGNEYSFLEGKGHYFSIVMDRDSPNIETFSRMRDSVGISTPQ